MAAIGTGLVMLASTIGVGVVAAPAEASSGPFTPTIVTTTSSTNVICRAYGGSLSANKEADQNLKFTVSSPNAVNPGQSYDIKIQMPISGFPRTDSSTGTTADIVAIYNEVSRWKLPSDLTINSVSLAPVDGNTGANADAGYYVAPADVPTIVVPNQGTIVDPNFDPMTLPANKRIAVPGTAPAAFIDAPTNTVRLGLLGTGTESSGTVYPGGSILRPPAVTINVTAKPTVNAGTDLGIKVAGQLPAGSLTGGQPGNYPAPTGISVNRTTAISSDTTWTDPTYVNYVYTSALGGFIKVLAKAACAPGWEATATYPTAPAYYTGPNAIPNGTAPLLNHTVVLGIQPTTPYEGAKYVTGATVPVAYACIDDDQGGSYDTCTGDLPTGALLNTSTPGTYSFTINASDAYAPPLTKTISYTVVDPIAPDANIGANQTGKATGTVVTLDGSTTTDTNGPPALPLTYTWTQTSGPAVTLSDSHAVKPTFTVAPVTTPGGDTYQFTLSVSNGFLSDSASTTVTSSASTPTVTVSKARAGGGSTFYPGDDMTLTATITNPDGANPADYTYLWTQTGGRTTALSSTTAANPTYRLPSSGGAPTTTACTSGTGAVGAASANCPTYSVVVTKTNTAKASVASLLAAYASSLPTRPVANAGASQNVPNAGATVTLTGSASAQAQGHALSYAWTQTAGPAVTLSSTTAQNPTFVAPAGGSTTQTYGFSLVVTDTQSPITGTGTNGNTSTTATTNVNVVPDHVVATASGTPTTGVAGTPVTLDGSASTEPSNGPLTYAWAQVNNGAPAVTLSSSSAAKPTFNAPPAVSAGGYTAQFTLTVTNGGPNPGDTDTTVTPVSITIAASTPTLGAPTKARDGGGASFFTGDRVTLSATITNPDGIADGDYTYVWVQTSGIPTALSSTTAAHPTFFVPVQSNGTTACTSGTSSATQNCPEYKVTVTKINTTKASAQSASLANYATTLATRPVANPGSAQTVKVGSTVTLSGLASTQAQGHSLSYSWTQVVGPAVTLSDPTAAQPTFVAPVSAGAVTFSLTVTDLQNPVVSGKTSTANTVLTDVTEYAAPVADAGTSQTVLGAGTVTLNAGASSQADGHTLSYQWTQTSGPAVTLSSATAQQPTFTAPNVGSVLTFTVTVTDTQNPHTAVASATSGAVTITVQTLPAVTSDPSNQTVTEGQSFSFSASASGSPAPSVQWQVSTDGGATFSDIAGATSTTYSATSVLGDDGHQFRAVFTNVAGSATSAAATLSVEPAPVAPAVTSDPSDQTVTEGGSFSFSAAASGTPAPTVQWQVSTDGGATFSDIAGATSSTYGGSAALADDGDQFRAVFTNSVSSATSAAATLSVDPAAVAPAVTSDPSDQTVTEGDSFSFSASASGTPAPTVQWQVSTDDGATFSNIPGATSSSFGGTSVLGDDGHQFRAVFTNSAGSDTSAAATLTVDPAAVAPAVTSDPSSQTVTEGGSFSFSASASGSPAPSVQWQVSTNGGVSFSDIAGATSTTYSATSVLGDSGHQFRAVFTNSAGSATSAAATLTVQPAAVAPAVTLDPSDASAIVGQPFGFSASASGSPAPSVQWQVSTDGGATFSNIGGATSASYGGTATLADDGHRFRAVFTNSAGSATSAAATLHITTTSVTVTSNVNPSTAGATVTFTAQATIVGVTTATGSVSFYDGATLLGTKALYAGKATLAKTAMTAGSHVITVVYNRGVPYALVTSSPLIQTVVKATTTATVSSNAPSAAFGQPVVLKTSVTRVAPGIGKVLSGTVELFDNGVSIGSAVVKSGVATQASISNLSVGAHVITAVFSGTSDDQGSTSATFTQTVNPTGTASTIVSTATATRSGQAVTIKTMVKPVAPGKGIVAGGTVLYSDNGDFYASVAVTNGVAALPATRDLSPGTHVFTAVYSGTPDRAGSTAAPFTITVSPADTTVVLATSAATARLGRTGSLTATVKTVAPGYGVPTGTVTFYDGAVALATVPVTTAGKATLALATLPLGVHSITATYNGSPVRNPSSSAVVTQTIIP